MLPRMFVILKHIFVRFSRHIQIGKSLDQVCANTLVLFPRMPNCLCCGICALVAFKAQKPVSENTDTLQDRIHHLALMSE